MSGIEITWEAPPEGRPGPRKYDHVLGQIKANPGRWARINIQSANKSTPYNAAQRLRQQYGANDEAWEFVARALDNGESGLFARYRTKEQLREKK